MDMIDEEQKALEKHFLYKNSRCFHDSKSNGYTFDGIVMIIPAEEFNFPEVQDGTLLLFDKSINIDLKKYKFIKNGEGQIVSKYGGKRLKGTWKNHRLEGEAKLTQNEKGEEKIQIFECVNGEIIPSKSNPDVKLNKVSENVYIYKSNGKHYKGEMLDVFFHGVGTLKLEEDIIFEGEFSFSKMHGKGKMTFPEGTYTGEFFQDTMEGKGVMNTQTGMVYEGEFKRNKFDGVGVLDLGNGNVYKGEFEKNLMQGEGVLFTSSGVEYAGKFKDNSLFENAEVKFPDGRRYKGEVSTKSLDGYGRMEYPDGSFVEGIFRSNTYIGVELDIGISFIYALVSMIFF